MIANRNLMHFAKYTLTVTVSAGEDANPCVW